MVGSQFSNAAAPGLSAQHFCVDTGTPNTAPKWIRNVVFSGSLANDFITAAVPLVDVEDGDTISLTGNALNNNATSGPTGIKIGAAASNITLHGNTLTGLPTGNYALGTVWTNVDTQRPPAPNILFNGGMGSDQITERASHAIDLGGR